AIRLRTLLLRLRRNPPESLLRASISLLQPPSEAKDGRRLSTMYPLLSREISIVDSRIIATAPVGTHTVSALA
ncbi:MAG: hypothetical protein ACRD33_08530, partial [Candidatus Acidiferrales bacterium]